MLLVPKYEEHLGALEEQLRRTEALTPDLIAGVIANACTRFAVLGRAPKTRVNQLIDSSAWTDVALAIVELELPRWKLRRLLYEDGKWHCSLSKQPLLPFGLDEVAEASHETLQLAILIAFLRARRTEAVGATGVATVPQVRRSSEGPEFFVCCDNFA